MLNGYVTVGSAGVQGPDLGRGVGVLWAVRTGSQCPLRRPAALGGLLRRGARSLLRTHAARQRHGDPGPRMPSAARAGRSSSSARTSRTPSRPWSSLTPASGSRSAVRPSRRAAPALPTPGSQAWSTPDWRPGRGGPCRRRPSGPGRPDRRRRGDTTAPQGQEEPIGVVRGDLRTPAQAHSSRRIHFEHGIAHLKNWRAPLATTADAST